MTGETCAALTTAGRPCRKAAIRGSTFCASHSRNPATEAAKLSPAQVDQLVDCIIAASPTDWRAAAWLLARAGWERSAPSASSPEPAGDDVADPFREIDEFTARRRSKQTGSP